MKYAASNSNRGAEREFSASEKLVRDWRKQKNDLQIIPRAKTLKTGISNKIDGTEDDA